MSSLPGLSSSTMAQVGYYEHILDDALDITHWPYVRSGSAGLGCETRSHHSASRTSKSRSACRLPFRCQDRHMEFWLSCECVMSALSHVCWCWHVHNRYLNCLRLATFFNLRELKAAAPCSTTSLESLGRSQMTARCNAWRASSGPAISTTTTLMRTAVRRIVLNTICQLTYSPYRPYHHSGSSLPPVAPWNPQGIQCVYSRAAWATYSDALHPPCGPSVRSRAFDDALVPSVDRMMILSLVYAVLTGFPFVISTHLSFYISATIMSAVVNNFEPVQWLGVLQVDYLFGVNVLDPLKYSH